MIRAFEATDIRRIKANNFSDPIDIKSMILREDFYKQTLVDEGGSVKAIICFVKYWGNNFLAFFLIADDMPAICARELKRFVYSAMADFRADRVQTDSVDCPMLNRWHKFLGFTLEGRREKMMNNVDYNCWGLLRGRDF